MQHQRQKQTTVSDYKSRHGKSLTSEQVMIQKVMPVMCYLGVRPLYQPSKAFLMLNVPERILQNCKLIILQKPATVSREAFLRLQHSDSPPFHHREQEAARADPPPPLSLQR